jgi:hypothetical protein
LRLISTAKFGTLEKLSRQNKNNFGWSYLLYPLSLGAIATLLLIDQHSSSVNIAIVYSLIKPWILHCRINRLSADFRRTYHQKKWSLFSKRLTERQFLRYFRMSKALFQKLCDKIEGIVGPAVFKREFYLDEIFSHQLPNSDHSHQWTNILLAHDHSTGGFISGEVKVAITLRILRGGPYLDLALLFESSFNHTHKILRYVVHDWLVHDSFYPINGVDSCRNVQQMQEVALQFSRASRGVINGCICIGALDGWIVKVQKPRKGDGVGNTATFYSRKG